jgi:hypothetical protein
MASRKQQFLSDYSELRGLILEGMTISHDNPLKATFQNVSNKTKTVSISAGS